MHAESEEGSAAEVLVLGQGADEVVGRDLQILEHQERMPRRSARSPGHRFAERCLLTLGHELSLSLPSGADYRAALLAEEVDAQM